MQSSAHKYDKTMAAKHHTNEEIRNMLCIKRADFFVSYGLGKTAKAFLLDLLSSGLEVASAINLNKDKERFKTKIYDNFKDLPGHNIFDKVLCIFDELPLSERENFDRVAARCLSMCAPNGMILLLGLNDKSSVASFIANNGITKFWFIGETDPASGGFDVLIKKKLENSNNAKRR